MLIIKNKTLKVNNKTTYNSQYKPVVEKIPKRTIDLNDEVVSLLEQLRDDKPKSGEETF